MRVLSDDERNVLSILDAQRDQAQHFYSDISEDILYLHAQSAVTLFDKILQANFRFGICQTESQLGYFLSRRNLQRILQFCLIKS